VYFLIYADVQLEIFEPAVSQQLKILRKADLVIGEKKG